MSEKESAQDVIEAYRKRQQKAKRTPMVIIGVAVLLLIAGAAFLVFW